MTLPPGGATGVTGSVTPSPPVSDGVTLRDAVTPHDSARDNGTGAENEATAAQDDSPPAPCSAGAVEQSNDGARADDLIRRLVAGRFTVEHTAPGKVRIRGPEGEKLPSDLHDALWGAPQSVRSLVISEMAVDDDILISRHPRQPRRADGRAA